MTTIGKANLKADLQNRMLTGKKAQKLENAFKRIVVSKLPEVNPVHGGTNWK